MCYGSGCSHEIRWGENAGECGKRKGDVCPESFEDSDEYWEYMERHPWDEAAVEDWDDIGVRP